MASTSGGNPDSVEDYSDTWKAIFEARLERLSAERAEDAEVQQIGLNVGAARWWDGPFVRRDDDDGARQAFIDSRGGDAPRVDATPEAVLPGGRPIEGSLLKFFIADIGGGVGEQRIIAELTDGAVIDPALLEGAEVTFFATAVDGANDVGSVRLFYQAFENGQRVDARFKVENFEPFALFGDANGDFLRGLTLDDGTFSLRYDVFTEDFARGQRVESETISFTVAEPADPGPDPVEDNEAPIANPDAGAFTAGEELRIDVLANDADPDGDALTLTRVLSATAGLVAAIDDGAVVVSAADGFSGDGSISYEVSDGRGGLGVGQVAIEVAAAPPPPPPPPANNAPIARNDFALIDDGETLRIDVLANDTDPDGDALTLNRIVAVTDGVSAAIENGAIAVTPNAGFEGEARVRYEISDGEGGLNQAIVTITVEAPNRAPQANDDDATLGPDESRNVDVLANDTDPDGDALTLTRIVSTGDGVSATVRNGLIAINPDAGFAGQTVIRYEVADGRGGLDQAELTVTVEAAPEPEPTGPRLSFFLVDIRGGVGEQQILAELSDGAVLEADLFDGAPVTIFATSDATDIGSVRLNYTERNDGVVVETIDRVENFAPFTLFGDNAGDFTTALDGFGEGEFTIDYEVLNGSGGAGATLEAGTFSFTVIDSTPEPDPDPDPDPDPGDPFQNGVIDSYVSGGAAATSFNIETAFIGDGWTVDFQRAFVIATDFLSDVIIGDTQDTPARFRREAVDDIRIDVILDGIDGRGGTLAFAGPRQIGPEGLSATGDSTFDIADIATLAARGTLDDVVVHEFFHALGSGTLFRRNGLFNDDEDRFTGQFATFLYNQEFPAIAGNDPGSNRGVPLTADGGHLSEEIFTNELNTPTLGGRSVLSQTSVAILEDLGYDTYLDNPFDDDDLFGPRPFNPVVDDFMA